MGKMTFVKAFCCRVIQTLGRAESVKKWAWLSDLSRKRNFVHLQNGNVQKYGAHGPEWLFCLEEVDTDE